MKRGRPPIWNCEKVIMGIKNLESELKRRPVKRDSSLLYSMSRKFYGSWNNAMKITGYKIKEYQFISSDVKITPEFCYFVGLVLTDGTIVRDKNYSKYAIMIYTSFSDQKAMILNLIKKLFNYNATVRERKYGYNKLVNYEIKISSKNLVEFFVNELKIPYGKKSDKIRIPAIIKSNSTLILNLLRGVIDGDGGIEKNYVTIYSSSFEFLNDIKTILKSLNIKSYKIGKSSKTVCRLQIPFKENMKLFNKIYGNAIYFYPRIKEQWKENILIGN